MVRLLFVYPALLSLLLCVIAVRAQVPYSMVASPVPMANPAPEFKPFLDFLEESNKASVLAAMKDSVTPPSSDKQVTDTLPRYVYPIAPQTTSFLQVDAPAGGIPSGNGPTPAAGANLSPIYILPTLPLQMPGNVLQPQGVQGMPGLMGGFRQNAAAAAVHPPPIDNEALANPNNMPGTLPQGMPQTMP